MAKDAEFAKPFDGAVSRFVEKEAPKEVRKRARGRRQARHPRSALSLPPAPGRRRIRGGLRRLQLELVKLQSWFRATGQRIVLVFEGRDAAGKGGAIQALTENLNPRTARIVALPAPSDVERGQWYFQRYVGAPAYRRRDRALRPLLVQPRRRRAGVRLVHAGGARALLPAAARVRGHAGAATASS